MLVEDHFVKSFTSKFSTYTCHRLTIKIIVHGYGKLTFPLSLQVKDICNELEVRELCHKILQNVSILLDADRGSLFLVQGDKSDKVTTEGQNGRSV